MRHLPVPPLIPDFRRITGVQWNDWLRLYLPLATYAAAVVVSLRWLWACGRCLRRIGGCPSPCYS